MQANDTSGQETDASTKTELRAQWEAFEYRVPAPGRVRVENTSYGEESGDHVYVVEVAEHVGTTACTCPADKYNSEPCKHRVAVEQQEAVMQAATANLSGAYPANESGESDRAVADGGTMADKIDSKQEETDEDDDALTCSDCGETFKSFLDSARHDRGDECDGDDHPETDGYERPARSEPADFGGGEGGIDEL